MDMWGRIEGVNIGLPVVWNLGPKSPVKRTAPTISTATASASPTPQSNSFGNALQQYLTSAGPSISTSNRFSAGLTAAENRLNALLDDPDSIQQSAAYKFRLGQGQEALQRQQAARGMLGSGNRLQELLQYGQEMGSQEYGAQANRLQTLLGSQQAGYLGERGANVAQFGAESAAHAQRGNMLASLYGTDVGASTSLRQAQLQADQQRAIEQARLEMQARTSSTWV